ncbi:MAG: hypothetical protein Q8T09_23640 [Candidatus Melainabacteria bacterium]|nr:hypothetical protein [Candidatus Melainabacteria bacterium]
MKNEATPKDCIKSKDEEQCLAGANYQKALDLTNREWQADVVEG